jgi:SAM-dependent methyltransferase
MTRDAAPEFSALLAELYDAVPLYRDRGDTAFYVAMAREAAGRVLELGCGTGRVLLPTARAGTEIAGLDRSTAMLERCHARLRAEPAEVRARVQLVRGDMAAFALDRRFALITAPFRSFQHLLRVEDQLACLRTVHRHLLPGGRLVFDVFHPLPAALHDPAWTEEREDVPETALAAGRRFRRTARVASFHRDEQVNRVELIFYLTHPDGRTERRVETFPMRYFFRYEVEHLLARSGFRLTGLYGDFDRSPFRSESPEMIFLAEKSPG